MPTSVVAGQLSPGMAVGAGGALMVGVNLLPPLGLIDFSVGSTDGPVVLVVVVVVVVDVSGVFFSSLPQAAVKPIIARMAAPPTAAETRRVRFVFIMRSLPLPRVVYEPAFGESLAIPHGSQSAYLVIRDVPAHQSHSEASSGAQTLAQRPRCRTGISQTLHRWSVAVRRRLGRPLGCA